MGQSTTDITELLNKAGSGRKSATEQGQLYDAVESELRAMAGRFMNRERVDHTLQPTVLVDEVFVALTRANNPICWESRRHFYRLAARAMRRILVDHAKKVKAEKRGGGDGRVHLPRIDEIPSGVLSEQVLGLNDALEKLAKESNRLAEVVELHWFAGYTFGEIAGIVRRSVSTVKNDWSAAKAWLGRELA